MSAFDQFDPFEQRVSAAMDEIAPARRPDYLDDLLRQTEGTSQRPRWSFAGRWLPANSALLPGGAGRANLRWFVLVAVVALLALAAAAIFVAGSRPKHLLPVGPAANGSLVYPSGGDLYIRDSEAADAAAQPLVTGPAKQSGPYISPDGQHVVYAQAGDGGDFLWATDIAGGQPRQILPDAIGTGWSQWSWALDSEHLLVSGEFGGVRRLYDVRADGSGSRELTFDGMIPWDAFWSPVDPDTFLLRAQSASDDTVDLYLAKADGTKPKPFGLAAQSAFGPDNTLAGAVWSPDGRTIAYNAIRLDPDSLSTYFRVHLVNADGTNDRELPGPKDVHVNEAWPTFSPDGKQLLVQHFIFPSPGALADGSGWIAVMPSDGSAPARDIGVRVDKTNNPDVWKDWSPNGKDVTEMVADTGKAYLVDPATGTSTELPWTDDLPAWQRTAP